MERHRERMEPQIGRGWQGETRREDSEQKQSRSRKGRAVQPAPALPCSPSLCLWLAPPVCQRALGIWRALPLTPSVPAGESPKVAQHPVLCQEVYTEAWAMHSPKGPGLIRGANTHSQTLDMRRSPEVSTPFLFAPYPLAHYPRSRADLLHF